MTVTEFPDMKTQSEIAALKGVCRAAVGDYIKRHGIAADDVTGGHKRYDIKRPVWREYLSAETEALPESLSIPPDEERLDYKRRWERARAEKLEIENQRKRGELIPRPLVAQVFSKIYSIHRSQFLNIGPSMSDLIASEMGIKATGKTLRVQELLNKESYNCLSSIKIEIEKFLKSIEANPLPDDLKKKPPDKKRKNKINNA
jgi:hypothetical protein